MTEWTDGENKSCELSVRFDVYPDSNGWRYECRIGKHHWQGNEKTEEEAQARCFRRLIIFGQNEAHVLDIERVLIKQSKLASDKDPEKA